MGEPLLLLPGMMCDARLFAPQIAHFSNSRPIQVSNFGQGNTIGAMANFVLKHAPPRFALAGLSMGGIVAMEVIRQAPQRITRLALLDTNHLAEAPDRAAARDPQIARALGGQLRAIMRDEMKPSYLADTFSKASILSLCMDMAEDLGPAVFEAQSRALQSRPDQTETLSAVQVPTLVLCGEQDGLCPPERHRQMQALLPDSRLKIISDAGHLPTLEQPETTNKELERWLSQT